MSSLGISGITNQDYLSVYLNETSRDDELSTAIESIELMISLLASKVPTAYKFRGWSNG